MRTGSAIQLVHQGVSRGRDKLGRAGLHSAIEFLRAELSGRRVSLALAGRRLLRAVDRPDLFFAARTARRASYCSWVSP